MAPRKRASGAGASPPAKAAKADEPAAGGAKIIPGQVRFPRGLWTPPHSLDRCVVLFPAIESAITRLATRLFRPFR